MISNSSFTSHSSNEHFQPFPTGSPLIPDISRAVLNVTEDDKMMKIENAWLQESSMCLDTNKSLISNSLGMESFWGLFFIVGVAGALVSIIYLVSFLQDHRSIINNSQLSVRDKIKMLAQHFDNKDLRSHTFLSIELQAQTQRNHDGKKRMEILSPDSSATESSFSPISLQVPQTPSSSTSSIQDLGTPSSEDFNSDQPEQSTSPGPLDKTWD